MDSGYIKLHRKVLENGWLKDPKLWALWCWCLLRASHKNHRLIVGCQQVELEPGQFVFGRKVACEELGITEREYRTRIDFLQNAGNMTIKTTNKFSIGTIVNWGTYQSQNGDKRPAERPTTDQLPTTNKNVKNVKKKDVCASREYFDIFYKAYPKHKAPSVALKSWEKINPSKELFEKIMNALKAQKDTEDWTKENGKYVPLPSTWLNQERWDDEIEVKKEVFGSNVL